MADNSELLKRLDEAKLWAEKNPGAGNPFTVLDGTDAASEIRRLNAENFSLAANQCHDGYGGEAGDHMCRYQDEIRRLEAKVEKLQQALAEIGNDCDPDDPEWNVPTDRRKYFWDICCAALAEDAS